MESGYTPLLRHIDRLYEPWMFWVFLLLLLSFTFVRFQTPSFIALLRNLIVNYRLARQEISTSEYPGGREWLIMWIPSMLSISLFLYLFIISSTLFVVDAGISLFLKISLAVSLMYLIKFMVMSAASTLSLKTDLMREYRANTILILVISALVLAPLSIGASLSIGNVPRSIWIAGASLFWLLYLIRLFRGSIAVLQQGVQFYYIILYLCALEFLPLLLVVKAWIGMYQA